MAATPGQAWLVCGVAGSGKSVLGRALAESLPGVLLDQDVLTGPLTRVVATLVGAQVDDLDDLRVRSFLGTAPYAALLDTAHDNLSVLGDVVLVAPFTSVLRTRQGLSLLTRLGSVDLRVVWARCPHDELLRRLAARGAPRDRRKLADPSALLEDEHRPPLLAHQVVDTTAALPDQVRSARAAPVVRAPTVGEQRGGTR